MSTRQSRLAAERKERPRSSRWLGIAFRAASPQRWCDGDVVKPAAISIDLQTPRADDDFERRDRTLFAHIAAARSFSPCDRIQAANEIVSGNFAKEDSSLHRGDSLQIAN